MKKCNILLMLMLFTITALAQKPALDHSVYDSWKNVSGISVPGNGDILTYAIKPQEGDGEYFIRNLKTGLSLSIPRASFVSVNENGTKAIAVIQPFYKDRRAVRIKKSKQPLKDTLAIIDLRTGKIDKYANYKSHSLPERFTDFFVFELSAAAEKPSGSKKEEGNDQTEKREQVKKEKELYLIHLSSMQIDTLKGNISSRKFNPDATLMAYTVEPEKKDSLGKASLMLYNLAEKTSREVLSGPKGSSFDLPSFSKTGTMAFVANTDTCKEAKEHRKIYLYRLADGKLDVAATHDMKGMREGWIISSNSYPSFSRDGRRLFFSVAPRPQEKDTSLVESEQPQLDIWSWHDEYLQPQQLLRRGGDLKRSYTAYVTTDLQGGMVQLGDEDIFYVPVPDDGCADRTLVYSNKKYRIARQWDFEPHQDVYIQHIDGHRELIAENTGFQSMSPSPDGKYAIAYNANDSTWVQISVETGEIRNLTDGLDGEFYDSDNDTPNQADPYGGALWFEDSRTFLIPDRYDFWKFDAAGEKEPEMFTGFYGRERNTQLKLWDLIENTDPDAKPGLHFNEPMYFSTFNRTTKETGLVMKDITKKKSPVVKLVEGPHSYKNICWSKPSKGKKGMYIYQRGSFEEGNNVWMTADNFKTQQMVARTNPQQDNYNWGTVELVNWQTADDIFCEGLLYKPEDFDPAKKYPVIIYFYEKRSHTLYNAINPAPSRSTINIAFYVSNGYIVFVPDIYYFDGHPGQSAMRSIMPGVAMLEKFPWIDGGNMAIQGQSWGGYQVAYMITQTDKFKAAGAGAPVCNMTSAYGGIRWGSGMTRQFQYEQQQSRIGKDLWSGFDLYYENSPLFFVPNVKTPVLIMHNDKDEAVPWYQGIEFFAGLRRCGKIAWLLQYNDESHNLSQRKNAKDLSIRLEQFFNHYLKGAPMPEWMKYGRPATKKGFDLGYELTEEN